MPLANLEISADGNFIYREHSRRIVKYIDTWKGWCIEYPVIIEPDGTKYTPLEAGYWK